MAATVDIPAADKVVYRISADHNESSADADISVFDDSNMDPAKVGDYAGVHSAVVDCNLVEEYAPRRVEMVITVVDCRTGGHANAVHRPKDHRSVTIMKIMQKL